MGAAKKLRQLLIGLSVADDCSERSYVFHSGVFVTVPMAMGVPGVLLLLALPSSWAQAPAFDRTSASAFDAAFQVHSAYVSLHAL